jgi:hypothetical protein
MSSNTTNIIKLSVMERVTLINRLTTAQPDPAQLRAIFKLQDKLDFTDEQIKDYGLSLNEYGGIDQINPNKRNETDSISLTANEQKLLKAIVPQLQWPANKLTRSIFNMLGVADA